jgi:hypothetical protein
MDMTGKSFLRDIELMICMILQEKGPMSLKELSQCIGKLKDSFEVEKKKAALDPSLGTIDGCVDDIPRGVRMLMTKGKLKRIGKTPRDWKYQVSDSFLVCDNIPDDAMEALRPFMEKDCPE